MITIATHSGSFHADDAVGVAVLSRLIKEADIIRTRDQAVIAQSTFAVDVGGEYDPIRGRFDHHQKGFSEKRANGIPYAGAGLVWKTHGLDFVKDVIETEQAQRVADEVDARLIQYIDAVDNGVEVPGPHDFGFSMMVDRFNPTWIQPDQDQYFRFMMVVQLADQLLENLAITIESEFRAENIVRNAPKLANGKVLVIDLASIPFNETICTEMPDVEFVVYPESTGGQWQVRVIPIELGSFVARKDLPEAWAGLRDDDLGTVVGINDAVFCHNGRFICGAKSKESAITMAVLAATTAT